VPSTQAGFLAAGCTLAIANLVLMVLSLAQDRPAAVARAWALATAAGAVGFVVLTGGAPVTTTIGAFLVAETAALVTLSVVAVRVTRAGARV